ncbi:MAG: hypothetical protein QM757_16285 [Paludibaculum sp.]
MRSFPIPIAIAAGGAYDGPSTWRLTVSTAFRVYPLTQIRWAVRQPDTFRFARGQELNGLAIDQSDVPQIESDGFSGRFLAHHTLNLGDIPGLDMAAE